MDFSLAVPFIRYCNVELKTTSDIVIAAVIFSYLDRWHALSIDKVAYQAHVSEATVSRFISKAGFKSFKEFKEVMEGYFSFLKQMQMKNHIERFKDVKNEEFMDSLYQEALDNLASTRQRLDYRKMEEAAQRMILADRVFIIGDYTENFMFFRMQLDLLFMKTNCIMIQKNNVKRLEAMDIHAGDCLVYLEVFAPWSDEIVLNHLKKAKEKGAALVVISQDHSQAAKMADTALYYGIEGSVNNGYLSLPLLNHIFCHIFYRVNLNHFQ